MHVTTLNVRYDECRRHRSHNMDIATTRINTTAIDIAAMNTTALNISTASISPHLLLRPLFKF